MTKIGMLDTQITTHQKLIDETKKVLEKDTWKNTPEIVEEIDTREKIDLDPDYIRGLLTYIRQHLLDQDEIEVKTEREGGHETYYWRLK